VPGDRVDHWDREMGAITQMLTEGGKGKAPAIIFDEVPGYPKGGLPHALDRRVPTVQPQAARGISQDRRGAGERARAAQKQVFAGA